MRDRTVAGSTPSVRSHRAETPSSHPERQGRYRAAQGNRTAHRLSSPALLSAQAQLRRPPSAQLPRSSPPAGFLRLPRRDRSDADRKSTRLNSSHQIISYAVFCLKKKKFNDQRLHERAQQPTRLRAQRIVAHEATTCLTLTVLNSAELIFFFFNDTATTEIYTLSLHDALPI